LPLRALRPVPRRRTPLGRADAAPLLRIRRDVQPHLRAPARASRGGGRTDEVHPASLHLDSGVDGVQSHHADDRGPAPRAAHTAGPVDRAGGDRPPGRRPSAPPTQHSLAPAGAVPGRRPDPDHWGAHLPGSSPQLRREPVNSTDRDAVIKVEHLSKRFRIPLDHSSTLKHRMTHWRSASRHRVLEALRDVSFEVPAGQFIGIIGHNGSGKSTLLKILARIYRPDAGRVAIEGKVSPFLELGVGFNPELTARENIFLSGAILGLGRVELHRLFEEIIGFADLEQFVDHKLKNFSSGMEVRLAFSLAIQAHAEILMMDEVLAVGDASFQTKCFDTFARYKREGRTVVLVTHELEAVNTYCDRALLLDH